MKCKQVSYSKIQPHTVVMNVKMSYRDQNWFLYQVVSMFISAVKFGCLTWGSVGSYLLQEPASSGHLRNCSFWHFHSGFIILAPEAATWL